METLDADGATAARSKAGGAGLRSSRGSDPRPGITGGASAATRARRFSKDAAIIVFERGPHASFANCGLPAQKGA